MLQIRAISMASQPLELIHQWETGSMNIILPDLRREGTREEEVNMSSKVLDAKKIKEWDYNVSDFFIFSCFGRWSL